MIRALLILLLLQACLVAGLYWPRDDAPAVATLLGDLDPNALDRIEVSDGADASVVLTKEGGSWILDNGLPVDRIRIAALTDALTRDPGLAIATSERAAARFAVDSDNFERRLRLMAGTMEYELYLGSSPAFRKIHARRAGDPRVYTIELNSYDAPAQRNDWLDKTLLAQSDVSQFELYGMRFSRDGEEWRRDDDAPVDSEDLASLLEMLQGLRVSGLVAPGDEGAAEAGEALRITLGHGDGARRLRVLENATLERYYLSSDGFDPLFDTSAYDAERLIDAARSLAGIPGKADADADSPVPATTDVPGPIPEPPPSA